MGGEIILRSLGPSSQGSLEANPGEVKRAKPQKREVWGQI